MYFNAYFADDYFNANYFGVDGETEILIGAYQGLYLGMYAKIYERR